MASQETALAAILAQPPTPLLRSLIFSVQARLIQTAVAGFVTAFNSPLITKRNIRPTFTKVYPVQSALTHRVFVPKSWKSGDAPLPLYLSIHGGGFFLGIPAMDDWFCCDFADDNKFLVISLDYHKAPQHPFPGGINGLVDTVKAILADDTLPFDKNNVAIGGFSAGANLSLAVSQDPSLQGIFKGLVSFYGVMDFSETTQQKLDTKPDSAPKPDTLEGNIPLINWGYMNVGQSLHDPQLSPVFAKQETLPPKIFFIGCEYDLLCRESEVMAEKMVRERSGQTVKSGDSWEQAGIKWEKVLAEEHGFEAMPASGAKKLRIDKRGREMFNNAGEWLRREVFA